ncbi:hypothetical protein FV219_10045 [Methylobacterium sp. WL122]|nr:hypothetical protein FV219_10045 [Methylobacterium sp. WL122]
MTPRPKSQGWVQTRVTSRWKLPAPPGQLSAEINTSTYRRLEHEVWRVIQHQQTPPLARAGTVETAEQ